MHLLAEKFQPSLRQDIAAATRYLQPEFDIENPAPATAAAAAALGIASPPRRPDTPRETPLIYQRERSAKPLTPAIVCPVPLRGRTLLTRAQTQSVQTAPPVAQGPDVTNLSAAARREHIDVSESPDCTPDFPSMFICGMMSIGGLIGGLSAAYIKK